MERLKDFRPAAEWKSQIPVPVCDEHPEYTELYRKAWELAHDHIKEVPGLPQTPYMDEAASPYDIWIWDTCFMSLFCKYAQSRFPGVRNYQFGDITADLIFENGHITAESDADFVLELNGIDYAVRAGENFFELKTN